MRHRNRNIARLLCGAAAGALSLWAGLAQASEAPRAFSIEPQPLSTALMAFGAQSGHAVMAPTELTSERVTRGVVQSAEPEAALALLLEGTGLTYRRTGETFAIVQAGEGGSGPQSAGAGGDVEALIVTAQKREENIQDVPIAISAFSQRDLEVQKIEGGPDIMRAVPNLTFSKSNFSSYNISIRGIGTKAISATTDPGVAVSFNNIGLITNRFFEQEFFDMERVEVLRGPQGTLYGRNATGGVVNLITAKPKLGGFEASLKGEAGNYASQRLVGMVNVPLVADVLGIRVAGATTQREGYDYNSLTRNRINGRDLWSLRTTVAFEPTSWLRANLVWERFDEDDNRSRTGKQLCHRDASPDMIGSTPTRQSNPPANYAKFQEARAALFSQGCKPGSLYSDDAFGTPNGLSLAFVVGSMQANSNFFNAYDGAGQVAYILDPSIDPYGGLMQSRSLREVASIRDPRYLASSDILELNVDIDLSDELTLSSQTVYSRDKVYSFQDYNRFTTIPIFNDTSNWVTFPGSLGQPSPFRSLAPGGVFCDPQIGCSNRMAVFDVSSAKSTQFGQEVRLQSDFSGPFDFSVGGNYTEFKTQNDYYVMSNLLTSIAMMGPFNYTADQTTCSQTNWDNFASAGASIPIRDSLCPYIDPNPVESIDGDGHNYFRSSNPYELKSYAAFGEAYYNINPDLKLTGGLRYTRDQKKFTLVPSQLLMAPTRLAGGRTGTGYPDLGDINVEWGEFTGRLGIDWKPDLGFTDQTLLYAFYSRGYKAGGVNPPTPDFPTGEELLAEGVITQAQYDTSVLNGWFPLLELTAVNYGRTFEPEFVDAFEAGMKNSMMAGRLTFNASAFFYDYKNYQVSQIKDRTAVNENFDAKIWGAELSAVFEPVDRLRLNANIGYLNTRIGKGEQSIDTMNRTLGDPNYTVVKPWVQLPSNCVVPTDVAEAWLQSTPNGTPPILITQVKMCGGVGGIVGVLAGAGIIDPATGQQYDVSTYPELNGGAGLYTDLSDNELPNSPHWTANLGAEYAFDMPNDWRLMLRGDAYWQSQSWARVYNLDPYDKLHGWYNMNLSMWVEQQDLGWKVELYIKNVLNDTPITDAFLNSDDSGLTTNVFMLDPRIYGVSVRKTF